MDTQILLEGLITGLLIFGVLWCWSKSRKNRMRTNMFHWMYNYRFDKVKSGGEYSDRDEEEFRFMMNKLRKQYSLSNKQALKILSIHYKSELENWDEIEDEFIGETK